MTEQITIDEVLAEKFKDTEFAALYEKEVLINRLYADLKSKDMMIGVLLERIIELRDK